jgi:hypothetical protein
MERKVHKLDQSDKNLAKMKLDRSLVESEKKVREDFIDTL